MKQYSVVCISGIVALSILSVALAVPVDIDSLAEPVEIDSFAEPVDIDSFAEPVDVESPAEIEAPALETNGDSELDTLEQDDDEENVVTVKVGFFSYVNSIFNDMASDNMLDSSEIGELINGWNAELSENIVQESEDDEVFDSFDVDGQSDIVDGQSDIVDEQDDFDDVQGGVKGQQSNMFDEDDVSVV